MQNGPTSFPFSISHGLPLSMKPVSQPSARTIYLSEKQIQLNIPTACKFKPILRNHAVNGIT